MPKRRRSDADLPKAPLELAHPLAIPGAAVAGVELLSDGTGPHATLLFRVMRLMLAWTSGAHAAASPEGLRRLEEDLLARMDDDELAAPLAVLAAAVQTPARDADRSRAAWACMCVADWAIERGARQTAIAYTQLAALAAPRNARYAWLAARLVFATGELRRAEPWYRRAHRVAVWTDDWEGQARALNSLGLSYFQRGKYPLAKEFYGQAIRVAQRRNLRHMEARTAHNLFVLYTDRREFEPAESYAIRTYELYGPTHPRLAQLIGDIAIFWNEQGFYRRTLPLFRALASVLTRPEDRIRILCHIARAAGGLGDRDLFFDSWKEMGELAKIDFGSALASEALYECGVGAVSLGEMEVAKAAFGRALEIAHCDRAAGVVTKADLALARMERGEDPGAEDTWAAAEAPNQRGEVFARNLLRVLERR